MEIHNRPILFYLPEIGWTRLLLAAMLEAGITKGLFMLHNQHSTATNSSTGIHLAHSQTEAQTSAHPTSHRWFDLILIASRRCSSFFAEAAVLVLVFGILDYFMLKGRIELPWIVGALAISVGLLAASIAMDFTAQSWMKSHP